MAVAALVISILALAVASVSALFSKRQTSVAERREAVDAGRRHDERTPSFTGDIESVNDGEWYRLWLRLTSTEELAHLQIDITESNGVTFATGQDGVIANGPSLHAESVGGLVSDQAIAWRVQLPENRPQSIRLRVHAYTTDDNWPVPVLVEIPPSLADSVW